MSRDHPDTSSRDPNPISVKAYAVDERGGKLTPREYKIDPLTDTGVGIEIHFCGLNANDVHMINGDWGECCQFPHVPGHEIAGIIREVGSEVNQLKVGDRVGLGFVKHACLTCDYCVFGHENQCDNMKVLNCPSGQCQGGLADYIRVHYSMVTRLPDHLPLAMAAPLMCSGLTVWAPLVKYSHENDRVGVVGFGGLGHLALKLARMRGQQVVVFDPNPEKSKLALSMGAQYFIDDSASDQMHKIEIQQKIDLLLILAESITDLKPFLPLMRKNGTICHIAASKGEVAIPIWPDLIHKQLHICGSFLGGRGMTRSMLQFCAKNNIGAEVNIYPIEKSNEAIDDMINNRIPFRAVVQIKQEP
jgi:D-arabinose 1-dehydrogenase-like Zn-dependent alcohol dehydrogenase